MGSYDLQVIIIDVRAYFFFIGINDAEEIGFPLLPRET